MSERSLETYLAKKAKAAKHLCFKWVSPSQRGVPDRILIAPSGGITFIELKNPDGHGKLSPLQVVTIEKLIAHQCDVRVLSSKEGVDALFA